MNKLLFWVLYICIITITSCKGQENYKSPNADLINFKINYNIIDKEDVHIKKILEFWNRFLNQDDVCNSSDIFWETPLFVKSPSFMYCFMNSFKEQGGKNQITVLSINKIDTETYKLKTIVIYQKDSTKPLMVDYIFDSYIRYKNEEARLICVLDLNMQKLSQKKIGNITYFYDPMNHQFNMTEATLLDKFNLEMSTKFDIPIIPFSYISCINTIDAYNKFGFDFIPEQFVPNQKYAGFTDPISKIIISGNNSEYYSHEVVHLYTRKYAELNNINVHTWVDEGIATFLGGSKGQPLEWHIKKLKKYLSEHIDTDLKDLNQLHNLPNGEYLTEYPYVIGGLIAKLVYEKEGMEGLLQMLKIENNDEFFFTFLKNKFGVTKDNFKQFINLNIQKY